MTLKNENFPTWAWLIYQAAEKGDRVLSRLSRCFDWRYALYDAFCSCANCDKRRTEGRQAPKAKSLFSFLFKKT